MPTRSRKRSASVRLALMGAAATTIAMTSGCGEDVQRNRYLSAADCVADYSEAQCRPDYPVGGYHPMGTTTSYYGPWYRSNYNTRGSDDPGAGRYYGNGSTGVRTTALSSSGAGHAPAGVEGGTRGGFGSHGVSARG